MRTLQENDELFINLMKLKTTFHWNGHELGLNGDYVKVYTEEAYSDLKMNTSEEFHRLIRI
jgi:hypothetical protein